MSVLFEGESPVQEVTEILCWCRTKTKVQGPRNELFMGEEVMLIQKRLE
jgi:hypothetical protein